MLLSWPRLSKTGCCSEMEARIKGQEDEDECLDERGDGGLKKE